MDVPIEFIALVGIVCGVLVKTFLPYFKKVLEDPSIDFNWGYVGTMTMSGIVSAVFVFPLFVIPEGDPLTIFIAAIFFAAGVNGVINYSLKSKIQKRLKQ